MKNLTDETMLFFGWQDVQLGHYHYFEQHDPPTCAISEALRWYDVGWLMGKEALANGEELAYSEDVTFCSIHPEILENAMRGI